MKNEGNEDRRFTIISRNGGMPLLLYEKNMDLGPVLEKLFGKAGSPR